MRFYCVFQDCNFESVQDVNSFILMLQKKEEELGAEFKLYSADDKQVALKQAFDFADNSSAKQSFVLSVDLKNTANTCLASRFRPAIHDDLWNENTVINWKVERLTSTDLMRTIEQMNGSRALEALLLNNLETVKKMQHSSWQPSTNTAWPLTGAGIGLSFSIALGMSIPAILAIGVIATSVSIISQRIRNNLVKKYYQNVDDILEIKSPYERLAIYSGLDSTSWLDYADSFTKQVTWSHPVAFATGLAIGTSSDQKMIDAVEANRPRLYHATY